MGASKQKWSQEEESALKSGVEKHGLGQWTKILKDPEFSGVLYLRSNVDLKDKWRNMNFMEKKWRSHGKSKLAVKRTLSLPKPLATTTSLQSDEEIVDSKHFSSALQVSTSSPPRRHSLRVDNLRMKAIGTLKEPGGSNNTAIRAYVEVNRKYMIPNSTQLSIQKKRSQRTVAGRQKITSLRSSPKTDRDEVSVQTRSQTEMAAVAAHAVAAAETAMAEAEEASKEAEVAEAEAEAAQAFAEEASKTLKGRNSSKVVKMQAFITTHEIYGRERLCKSQSGCIENVIQQMKMTRV